MKIAEYLVAGVLAASIGGFAVTRSSSSRPASRSYSSTRTSSTSTKPTAWKSSNNYGTGKSTKIGKAPLKSKTPAPQPHTYQGTKYNSSVAPYTNTGGFWVYYWLSTRNGVQCYDKNHKRISCNRDDKSYSTNW